MKGPRRWACPSQKEEGLQAYPAFVLLYCIIAMNIVVPVTAELMQVNLIGAGMYYVGSPAI